VEWNKKENAMVFFFFSHLRFPCLVAFTCRTRPRTFFFLPYSSRGFGHVTNEGLPNARGVWEAARVVYKTPDGGSAWSVGAVDESSTPSIKVSSKLLILATRVAMELERCSMTRFLHSLVFPT
jgi:hypothetical protein